MSNKKAMKKLLMIAFTAIFALSLTACGIELSPAEGREQLKESELAKIVPLSEAFAEEGIWFLSNNSNYDKVINKDDSIQNGILHFDGNGNVTYYYFINAKEKPTFTSLKGLSDTEILEMAEKLASDSGTITTSKFTLTIKTDGTGNNTESEQLTIGDQKFSFNTALSNQVVFNHTYSGLVNMEDNCFSDCIITEIENEHPGFKLDTPDTEGITID